MKLYTSQAFSISVDEVMARHTKHTKKKLIKQQLMSIVENGLEVIVDPPISFKSMNGCWGQANLKQTPVQNALRKRGVFKASKEVPCGDLGIQKVSHRNHNRDIHKSIVVFNEGDKKLI